MTRLTAAVPVRQAPAQYTGADGARQALTEAARLLAAAQPRPEARRPRHDLHYRGAIISRSSQVEVELTLAAQPAGALQRPEPPQL